MAKAKEHKVMGKSLTNEEDVAQSQQMAEGQGGGSNFLKIPEKRTPFYILTPDYVDGWVHWVTIGKGQRHKVVCGGGPEGHGMDTQNCAICDRTMSLYKEAKELRENPKAGNDAKTRAGVLKEMASAMKAKYECHLIVAQGIALQKKVTKGGKTTYEYEADFPSGEGDGEESMKVGILSLTNSQMLELMNLVGNSKYPFMKSGKDRLNRVIWSVRGKNESGNAKVFWVPESTQSDAPADEEAWKEIDTSKDFDIDTANIEKTYALLTGEGAEEEEDEGDVKLEDEESEEDESASKLGDVGDDFLDDDPEEDAKKAKAAPAKKGKSRK